MLILYSEAHLQHDPPAEFVRDRMQPYSEAPARAEVIVAALRRAGYDCICGPRDGSLEILASVHDPAYLSYLERIYPAWRAAGRPAAGVVPTSFAGRGLGALPAALLGQPGYYCFDAQTPVVGGTLAAARGAARCALTGAELLLEGHPAAYALCRPPGHHAGRALYGGYCYLNNAAVAAARLGRENRVAILDIDYHHGNGTQDIFYDSDQVFFVSLHADPDRAYPWFSGYPDERGAGPGRGCNRNYPLPLDAGEARYLEVLDQALREVARFDPSFLVVSAGVDTCRGDPLGGFDLSPEIFARIGERIRGAGLPALLVQEGGYDLRQIGKTVLHLLQPFQ